MLNGTDDYRASGPLSVPYYWYGHLSIVYDNYDPEQIRISVDLGAVKYELLGRLHYGDPRIRTINDERHILGVFLVQMFDDRTIKVEVVAGRMAEEVQGFSDVARTYRR